MKESSGGDDFMYDILIHCKNLCKCHNVPPPITPIDVKKKKKPSRTTNDKYLATVNRKVDIFCLISRHNLLHN
jgi:hypothetical protein